MTHTTIYEIEITSSRPIRRSGGKTRRPRMLAWLLIGAGIKLALVAVALLLLGSGPSDGAAPTPRSHRI